jgi:hypothetical protein
LAPAALTAAGGGGAPHNNLQSYLALNFASRSKEFSRRTIKAASRQLKTIW